MKILVLGGTRFFGIPMIEELLRQGNDITIATRQHAKDNFGDKISRIKIERTDPTAMKNAFNGKKYDVVYDKIAYCSNDIRSGSRFISVPSILFESRPRASFVFEPSNPR